MIEAGEVMEVLPLRIGWTAVIPIHSLPPTATLANNGYTPFSNRSDVIIVPPVYIDPSATLENCLIGPMYPSPAARRLPMP